MKLLYLFNRSLRVEDNNSLRYCEELCKKANGSIIHCIFVFDPRQINTNEYFSISCFSFMIECLKQLSDQLKGHISFFYNNTEEVIHHLQQREKYDYIILGEDYTPFARNRLSLIMKKVSNVIEVPDVVINTPHTVKPYKKFKPYYVYCHNINKKYKLEKTVNLVDLLNEVDSSSTSNSSTSTTKMDKMDKTDKTNNLYLDNSFYSPVPISYKLQHVVKLDAKNLSKEFSPHSLDQIISIVEKKLDININKCIKQLNLLPGCNFSRKNALLLLDSIRKNKKFTDYLITRDDPNLTTTRLSALMKFGVVSIREVYESLMEGISSAKSKSVKDNLNGLLREIYFRQFYIQTTYHFGKSPNELYNDIKWINDKKQFTAWKTGTTGIPFVDAGMRQLNTEFWMHNRLRMIVASFLIKNLLIDWRWGEKYFAQSLVDYDYSSNLGGWLFSLGSLDGMPYFRVFNPVTQGIKHDPDATYIKKYVPELTDLTPKEIHNWGKSAEYRKLLREKYPKSKNYPDPIVDLDMSHKRAIEVYKKALK